MNSNRVVRYALQYALWYLIIKSRDHRTQVNNICQKTPAVCTNEEPVIKGSLVYETSVLRTFKN